MSKSRPSFMRRGFRWTFVEPFKRPFQLMGALGQNSRDIKSMASRGVSRSRDLLALPPHPEGMSPDEFPRLDAWWATLSQQEKRDLLDEHRDWRDKCLVFQERFDRNGNPRDSVAIDLDGVRPEERLGFVAKVKSIARPIFRDGDVAWSLSGSRTQRQRAYVVARGRLHLWSALLFSGLFITLVRAYTAGSLGLFHFAGILCFLAFMVPEILRYRLSMTQAVYGRRVKASQVFSRLPANFHYDEAEEKRYQSMLREVMNNSVPSTSPLFSAYYLWSKSA